MKETRQLVSAAELDALIRDWGAMGVTNLAFDLFTLCPEHWHSQRRPSLFP